MFGKFVPIPEGKPLRFERIRAREQDSRCQAFKRGYRFKPEGYFHDFEPELGSDRWDWWADRLANGDARLVGGSMVFYRLLKFHPPAVNSSVYCSLAFEIRSIKYSVLL